MAEDRAGHAATLAANGDVIVAGGGGGAERYMPASDTWSPFGSMLAPDRQGNTTTLLPDGRLLVGFGLLTKDKVWATVNIELTSTLAPALGQPCTTSATCNGAVCVDGVCCNSSCNLGSCDACTVALGASADGICTTFPGAPCDDGTVCTTGDTCTATGCTGTSVTGIPCDDGNACTTGDTCVDTGCQGTALNGTSCDDGVACTNGDSCFLGVCTGYKQACMAPDLCHDAGYCSLQAGGCADQFAKVCPAAGECNVTTCDLATGNCTGPASPVPDGTSCTGGTCQSGTCVLGSGSGASATSSTTGVGGASATSSSVGVGGASASSASVGVGSASASSSSVGVGGASVASSSSVGATTAGTGGAPATWVAATSSSAGPTVIDANGGCSSTPMRTSPASGAWLGLGLLGLTACLRRRRSAPRTP